MDGTLELNGNLRMYVRTYLQLADTHKLTSCYTLCCCAVLVSPSGRMVERGEPDLQRAVAEVVGAFYSEVPDNPAVEGV